jgi:hypothetical protein
VSKTNEIFLKKRIWRGIAALNMVIHIMTIYRYSGMLNGYIWIAYMVLSFTLEAMITH